MAAGGGAANNDTSPRFPCNYAGANLICVGASTSLDNLSSFSNFGASSVDLAAPGGEHPGTAVNSAFLYGQTRPSARLLSTQLGHRRHPGHLGSHPMDPPSSPAAP